MRLPQNWSCISSPLNSKVNEKNKGSIALLFVSSCLLSQDQVQLVFSDFHDGAVTGTDISRNNKWILTGGADGRAMSIDIENRIPMRQFRGHTDALTQISFADRDNKYCKQKADPLPPQSIRGMAFAYRL